MIPIMKFVPTKEMTDAVTKVIESGYIVQGKKVEEFENAFAQMHGAKYGIAVTNGTVALELMYKVFTEDIDNPYFITNPLSFVATVRAMTHARPDALISFIDVDESYSSLYPPQLREVKSDLDTSHYTPIKVSVDLHGVRDDSPDFGLIELRDSCQAHGGINLGDSKAAAFSFHASKNVTCAEGGMIITNDSTAARRLGILRSHGIISSHPNKYSDVIDDGYNARMTDIQAAIGIESLKTLKERNAKRVENANFYDTGLEDTSYSTPIKQSVYHHYMLQHRLRDEIITILRYKGIDARIYYPEILPDIFPWADTTDIPRARIAQEQLFAIPVHEHLTNEERRYILETLIEVGENVGS